MERTFTVQVEHDSDSGAGFGATPRCEYCGDEMQLRCALCHKPPGKITQHWLVSAYERVCAGESEVEVMNDYGYEPRP